MRRVSLIAGLIAFALVVSACSSGDSSDSSGSASGPIKIGIIADLSGPFTTYGTSFNRSAELAVNEINADGGIMDREIELIVEDSQSDVAATVDKAKKLIRQDEVDLVIGPIGSDENDAGSEVVANDAGELYFYTEGYEGGKCLPTYFSFGTVPAQQTKPFIPFLQEQFGPRVFLFGADYVWPHRSFEVAKETIESSGGSLVGELYLPVVTDDFSQLVQEVRSAQPDYMYALYPAVFGPALKALNDAGLLGQMGIANAFVGDPDLPGVASLAEGMYTTLSYSQAIDTPAAQKFLSDFQAEYGADALPAGNEGVNAYDAIYLYKQAVEQAKSTDATDVAQNLVGQSFEGPTGEVTMTDSHHLKQSAFVVKVDNGQYEFVTSFDDLDPEEPACST
jgi:ABC-type branched-subunit amino acid transport system substrate-binding protein